MQSTKVDIVYYVVPSDYGMEFDLSGCCRMRLLTTSTVNKKEYIDGLSRAVSRSKIIIACGPIYGEDGLIYTTSKAIGKPLKIINNKEFGIVDDQNVRIIEGSFPLVTTSGIFGGLIIESGPQTLIILSENTAVRKSILKNLIHPYIQELSLMEIRKTTAANHAPAETVSTEAAATEQVSTDSDTPTDQEEQGDVAETQTAAAEDGAEDNGDSTAEEAENTEKDPLQEEEAPAEITDIPPITVEETEEEKATSPYDEALLNVARDVSLISERLNSLKSNSKKDAETARTGTPMISNIDFVIDKDNEGKEPVLRTPTPATTFFFNDQDIDEEDDSSSEKTEDETHSETNKKNGNKSLNISIIIIAALLLVILAALCYFIFYIPYQRGITTEQFFKEMFEGMTAIGKFVR